MDTHRASRLCAALALLAAGCGSDPNSLQVPNGWVEGVLALVVTGEPVADAGIVLVEAGTLRTGTPLVPVDAQGHYRVAAAPGEYAVVIIHDYLVIYQRPDHLVRVRPGRTTRHDLTLQSSDIWNGGSYRIKGIVLDASTGAPIPGAYVERTDLSGVDIDAPFFGTTIPGIAITDSAGHFILNTDALFLDQQRWTHPISVTKSGYEPYSLVGRGPEWFRPGWGSLLPAPDSLLNVEIRMQAWIASSARGTVRGRLEFAERPVAGVRVGLSLQVVANPDTMETPGKTGSDLITAPLPDHVGVSDSQGEFTIAGIPFGTYRVIPAYLTDDGYVAGWMRDDEYRVVTLRDSESVDVGTIELARSLQPLDPPDGARNAERSPLIQWEALTGLPAGYTLVDYTLQIDNNYTLDVVISRLTVPSWQVPVRILPGSPMRWLVDARVVREATKDTLVLASFERAATFVVGSDVEITVSPGTKPVFSWLPAVAVYRLVVVNTKGAGGWHIRTDSTNIIVPPVRYGVVPPGARELRGPSDLIAGQSYFLVLARTSTSNPDEILAVEVFTP